MKMAGPIGRTDGFVFKKGAVLHRRQELGEPAEFVTAALRIEFIPEDERDRLLHRAIANPLQRRRESGWRRELRHVELERTEIVRAARPLFRHLLDREGLTGTRRSEYREVQQSAAPGLTQILTRDIAEAAHALDFGSIDSCPCSHSLHQEGSARVAITIQGDFSCCHPIAAGEGVVEESRIALFRNWRNVKGLVRVAGEKGRRDFFERKPQKCSPVFDRELMPDFNPDPTRAQNTGDRGHPIRRFWSGCDFQDGPDGDANPDTKGKSGSLTFPVSLLVEWIIDECAATIALDNDGAAVSDIDDSSGNPAEFRSGSNSGCDLAGSAFP